MNEQFKLKSINYLIFIQQLLFIILLFPSFATVNLTLINLNKNCSLKNNNSFLECFSLNDFNNYFNFNLNKNNSQQINQLKLNCMENNQTFNDLELIKNISEIKKISDLSLHKCPQNVTFQFTNLPKIEKLNLSGNELNEFNWQELSSSKLSLIDLRNNPLNCNKCSNFWLRTRKKALSKQIINGWNIRTLFPTIPERIIAPSLNKCSFSQCKEETAKFEEKDLSNLNLGDKLELKCKFKTDKNLTSTFLNKIFIWPFNRREDEEKVNNSLKLTKTILLPSENAAILQINSLNNIHLGPIACRCLHCSMPGIFDIKELHFPVPLNVHILGEKGKKKIIILRGYPIGFIRMEVTRKEDNKTDSIEFGGEEEVNSKGLLEGGSYSGDDVHLLFNNSLTIKPEIAHSSYFIRYFTISIHECTNCNHSQKGGFYDFNICIGKNKSFDNCVLISNLNIVPPEYPISNIKLFTTKNAHNSSSPSFLSILLSIPPILFIIGVFTICGRTIWKFKQRIEIREKLKRKNFRRGSRNTQRTEETSIPLDTMSRTLSLSNYIQSQLHLPLISEDDLQLNECIGKGAFGEVYIAKWRYKKLLSTKTIEENEEENHPMISLKENTNKNIFEEKKVAIKMLINIQIDAEMEREAALLANLEHPNVLKMFGVAQWRGQVALVLELMSLGDLRNYLYNRKPCCTSYTQFPPPLINDELIDICIQITEGLCYLAGQQIVHRDLAARNCLVSGESDMRCSSAAFRPPICVKIGDFGMSRRLYASADYYKMQDRRKALPVRWMAPECLSNGKFTSQSDIWSLGVLFFEIFSFGSKPFDPLKDDEVIIAVLSGMRPKVPEKCKPELAELMKECWHRNPQKRLSVVEVLQRLKKFRIGQVETPKENGTGMVINSLLNYN
uniref:Protein kinase domain-containing protein n=1 Tax=Meloidogyne floridensis TaxID=298350 RepID=A0A915P330_9BILA